MPRMVHFINCLAAIRQTVFGRDNRTPIADSIQLSSTQYTDEAREVKAKDDYRIASMAVNSLPEEDCFTLVFTRTNGK